jgi:high-affinity iron transporter
MKLLPSLAVILLLGVSLRSGAEERPANGETLFATHCQMCHGPQGKGDGPAGRVLDPPPRDLTKRPYKQGCGPGAIVKTLRSGVDGSAMPSFASVLSDPEMRALASYVRSLQQGCQGCQGCK